MAEPDDGNPRGLPSGTIGGRIYGFMFNAKLLPKAYDALEGIAAVEGNQIGEVGRSRRWEAMAMSLDAAAEAFREAIRETVKRYALWYLIEGVLLVVAGILAIVYPVISTAAVVVLLGWLLIISGVLQGLSLIGARHVPHFWL